jgi:hypothetical protein
MKLGKAYDRGSCLKIPFILSVLKVSFGITCTTSVFTRNTRQLFINPKSLDLFRYRNTPPIIIELHCKWRRQTRTDTENFIDRYRILYIFKLFFI